MIDQSKYPFYNVDYNFFRNSKLEKGGYFTKKYDQPTYLTFKLVFGYQGDQDYNKNNLIYDKMPHPLFYDKDQYKDLSYVNLNLPDVEYSTLNYLRNSNEHSRASMLKTFIESFNNLQDQYQYYFQSITGLDQLIKADPKKGIRVPDNTQLTIKCLEAIDLRCSYLLNLYKKIVWDETYQKWVVPDMMRYFTLDIYIFEIRTFHEPITKTTEVLRSDDESKAILGNVTRISSPGAGTGSILTAVNSINSRLPFWRIRCEQCEFDITSLVNSSFSELSIAAQERESTFEFKVNVGQINEIQKYSLFSIIDGTEEQPEVILNDVVLNGIFRTSETVNTTSVVSSANITMAETNVNMLQGVDVNSQKVEHVTGMPFNESNLTTDNNGNPTKTPPLRATPYEQETFTGNAVKFGNAFLKNTAKSALDKAKMTPIAGVSYNSAEAAISSQDINNIYGLTKRAILNIAQTLKPSERLIVEKIISGISIFNLVQLAGEKTNQLTSQMNKSLTQEKNKRNIEDIKQNDFTKNENIDKSKATNSKIIAAKIKDNDKKQNTIIKTVIEAPPSSIFLKRKIK